ncbi:MAG: DUF721 domain-containing protein [Deltaproteobacteria bacterium]|nr:DUF721 domain-containing protein [Deltaproteobacteria bacterium]
MSDQTNQNASRSGPSKSSPVKRARRVQSLTEALEIFFSRHKGRGNLRLPHLWEHWPMVMGDPLWRLALPLGVQDRVLLVGAEDNMLMHELSFHTPEMLARANAFMDEEYFGRVRVELVRGRMPLYPPVARPVSGEAKPAGRPKPPDLGSLGGKIDPESPFGRAYLSYLGSFEL